MPPPVPVTIPEALTVAVFTLLLLHVPPAVASLSAVEAPAHTEEIPLTAAGNGVTVSVAVV